MVKAAVCLVAEMLVRDADTNAISVFNILEEISTVAVPFFITRISFFTLLERSADDPPQFQGKFSVILNEQMLIEKEDLVDFGPKLRTRVVINIGGLVVPNSGFLQIRFAFPNGSAEYSIPVHQVAQTVVAN